MATFVVLPPHQSQTTTPSTAFYQQPQQPLVSTINPTSVVLPMAGPTFAQPPTFYLPITQQQLQQPFFSSQPQPFILNMQSDQNKNPDSVDSSNSCTPLIEKLLEDFISKLSNQTMRNKARMFSNVFQTSSPLPPETPTAASLSNLCSPLFSSHHKSQPSPPEHHQNQSSNPTNNIGQNFNFDSEPFIDKLSNAIINKLFDANINSNKCGSCVLIEDLMKKMPKKIDSINKNKNNLNKGERKVKSSKTKIDNLSNLVMSENDFSDFDRRIKEILALDQNNFSKPLIDNKDYKQPFKKRFSNIMPHNMNSIHNNLPRFPQSRERRFFSTMPQHDPTHCPCTQYGKRPFHSNFSRYDDSIPISSQYRLRPTMRPNRRNMNSIPMNRFQTMPQRNMNSMPMNRFQRMPQGECRMKTRQRFRPQRQEKKVLFKFFRKQS